jgi:photosystem II stability/assembly factor-like uncharacterized protein
MGLALGIGFASAQARKGGVSKNPSVTAAEPKFKAIWEPVPFPKDIALRAIACVGPETCWIAGDKSTILHTTNGGKTWNVQLGGDPESMDEDLVEINFLDDTHGWVMSERNRIMATADGSTWAELGKVPATSQGLWFVSPQVGWVTDRSDSQTQSHLNRTDDGGKTWKRGYPCSVDAVIDGLARKLGCMVRNTQFVSPTVGYIGGGAPINMGTDVAAISKTIDGGDTWTNSIIPDTRHRIDRVHFWSEKDGLVLLASGQTFWTSDGGASWTGSTNPPAWRSHYATGGGKIIVGINENGRQIGYSFDGGRSFTTRAMNLPARVWAAAFADSTHGYIAGEHGMVYRYRIVPVDFTAPGIIAAAAPASGK